MANSDMIVIYKEHWEAIKDLSMEQKASILNFIFTNEVQNDPIVKVICTYIGEQFKRRAAFMEQLSKTRAELGRLGGIAKASKTSKSQISQAKLAKSSKAKQSCLPSPSPSPSPCLKKEEEKKEEKNKKPDTNVSVHDFIVNYCELYKAKFQVNPVCNGIQAAAATRIIKAVGLENAKLYTPAYLKMQDQWFKTKAYDLVTFAGNLNKIAIFAQTGKVATRQQSAQDELIQGNLIAMQEALDERRK